MHFTESPEFEVINVERLKRSSEAVSRAREFVSEAKRQIEESMELVEELQTNKSRTELLYTTYKTRTDARNASLEWAKALKNEARRLRNRFTRLKRATPRATNGRRLKRSSRPEPKLYQH